MSGLNPALLWFIVGTVLVLLEFAVPGVILVFFGVAAWFVSLGTWLGVTGSLESQLFLFALTSILLLFFLRRWIRERFTGHVTGVQDPSRNLDDLTGETVTVLNEVVPGKGGGTVEFKGAVWSAESTESLARGAMAVITGVRGITLRVASRKEEAP